MYNVKLKNEFYIYFNFHFSILKRKTIGSQTEKIYKTVNRLCSKLNIFGVNLYDEITKTRWLQKRSRIFLNSFYLTLFLLKLGIESFKRKKKIPYYKKNKEP